MPVIGAEERARRANFFRARVAHVAAAALIRGLLAPLVDLTREPGSSRCLPLSVSGGSSDDEADRRAQWWGGGRGGRN